MAKILTRLRIDEVSSVDRGAGEGVKILLMKRNSDKREAMSTESKLSKMFSKLFGGGDNNDIVIDKSVESLAESISSILADDKVADPAAEMTKTFEQFGDYLKSTLTAGPAVAKKEGSDMDLKVLAKALGLAETATEADVSAAMLKNINDQASTASEVKKLASELKLAKAEFTTPELAFYEKAFPSGDDDGDDPKMSDADKAKKAAKKAFRLASHSERGTIMKSAEPPVPAHIQKIMDDNAAMAKRIADLEGSGNLVEMTKRATDIGLPASEGVTFQKAYAGDREAIDKMAGFIKAATAAAKAGGVFKEFGSSSGTGVITTAYDELVAKAQELQKSDPKLTFPSAFSKVYEDPSNIEIVKRERGENRPSAA